MVNLLLEFGIPVSSVAANCLLFRAHYKLRNPKKMTFSAVAYKVGPVDRNEIENLFRQLEEMDETQTHLPGERRRTKTSVLKVILDDIGSNAFFFQCGLFSEKDKIDPVKPAIDHEDWEALVHVLIDEVTELRVKVFEARKTMLIKAIKREPFEMALVQDILEHYKVIEGDIIALLGMGETRVCRELMINHLGLAAFYLTDGGLGGGGPEVA